MNEKTDFRPNNETEFVQAVAKGEPLWADCIKCGHAFTGNNVHSRAGWRETQITGYCEDCFDEIFKDEE